jgi:hypothetical protein
MRARAVLLAFLPLALAASPAAAQRYSSDCVARPNDRGGTYISCARRNDYAAEQRRIASEARRETRAMTNRIRAESRAIASAARADARAFQRRVNADRTMLRLRERVNARVFERPSRSHSRRW